jgi:hypothetical protein
MTSYIPQIVGVGETKFTGNGQRFATEAEALAAAAEIQGRWMGCKGGPENRRAAPSEDRVNYRWENGRAIMLAGPGEVI